MISEELPTHNLPSRDFPEVAMESEVVFSGTLKDESLTVASRKLKFITGNTPPNFIYLLATNNGLSLLFDNKSRTLNITISRNSFTEFKLV